MQSRFHRLPFHPGYEYRATKPFVMSGVQYSPGMVIDKRGVEDRRLRQMYESFMVEPCGDPPAAAGGTGRVAGGTRRVVDETNPAPGETKGVASDTAAAVAEHRGFGRWYVVRAGAVVSGPHNKAEAEQAAAAL